MRFLEIERIFGREGIFSAAQAVSYFPSFDKANFGRWCRKGLLIKLRNGLYAFPEAAERNPAFHTQVANAMYKPSYVSLEYAMAMHEMIPETVLQVTSVTSLKTWQIENAVGVFSYHTIRPDLLFGWIEPEGAYGARIATAEKALLDFLWLNPRYKDARDMEELRLDESFMADSFNRELAGAWAEKYKSPALEKRMRILYKTYGI